MVKKILLGLIFSFLILAQSAAKASAAFYTTQINSSTYRNLGTPEGILRLVDGNMWYADSTNYRIIKISATGTILRTVGRQGSDEGEFSNVVKSITQDENGDLYVLDYCHVYRFDSYGGYKTSWGSCADGDGQFSNAMAIHYSQNDGSLIVSDTGHDRIIKFDKDGNLLSQFGTSGTGNGELNDPWGLTTNSNGDIYVVDSTNHRVQVFTKDGVYLSKFGSSTPGDFEFVFPKDIEILSNGQLIVTSQNNQTIKKFDSTGTTLISAWGSNGTGNSEFNQPQFMAVDTSDDSIWITDTALKRLQHFTNTGTLVSIIQNTGSDPGQFIYPYSVDFDSTGNMYVLDNTGRVQKFDSNGDYLSTVIASGTVSEPSMFHLTINQSNGDILMSTETNVYVYDSNGAFVRTLGNHGVNDHNSGDGDFNHARGIDIDGSGNIYVADLFNDRVQKFNSSGTFLTKWSVVYPEEILVDGSFVYVSSPSPTGDPEELKIREYDTSGVLQGVYLDQWGVDVSTQYYVNKGIEIHDGRTYISDPNNDRIMVYNSDGSFAEMIGTHGSGTEQFDGVASAKFNPITGDLVAVDTNNHRVQILVNGVKIKNLNPSADVINTSNSTSLVNRAIDPNAENTDSLGAELYFGDYIVSDFVVDLTQDRDWANVNTIMLPDESKSLVVNLNPTDAPGISSTHSLFVVKAVGQTSVRVCTDATLISDVNSTCTGYVLNQGDPNLSVVSVDGTLYWKVSGLTGTGAMGVTPAASPSPSPSSSGGSSSSSSGGSSSNGGGSSSSSGCTSEEVFGTPNLFQINVLATTAKLFFSPLPNANTFYFSYGTKPDALEHGVEVTLAREGVQNYTISLLKPNTTYYFKVRGQNGCKPGQWSNIMQIKTQSKNSTKMAFYYKTSSIVSTPLLRKKTSVINQVTTKTEPLSTFVPESNQISEVKQSNPTPPKKCYFWGLWCK